MWKKKINSTDREILFEWSHNYYRISSTVSEVQTGVWSF